jgi:hypothetical protein
MRARSLGALLLLASSTASSHNLPHPQKIAAAINTKGLLLRIAVEIPRGEESLQRRRLADRDNNKILSEEESEALLLLLEEETRSSLTTRLDGKRLSLQTIERRGAGHTGAVERSQELQLFLTVESQMTVFEGLHVFSCVNRLRSNVAELVVTLSEDFSLLLSSQGKPNYAGQEVRSIHLDAKTDVSLVFLVPN